MATKLEYAQLSANVYRSSTSPANRIGVPRGWQEYVVAGTERLREDPATGFEARAYRNTSSDEIVISYAGTDTKQVLEDILTTNRGLGIGETVAQLKQAAEFYTRVKQAAGNAPISLTGHSLGGGLAALVGVFFDVDATTFDPAPFRAAAKESNRNEIVSHLLGKQLPIDANLVSYSTGFEVPIPGILPFSFIKVPTTIARESRVSAVAMQGEFLTGQGQNDIRDKFRIYGADKFELVTHGNADTAAIAGFQPISAMTLHSMALMTAMLTSKPLRDVTSDLRALIPAIFDTGVYAQSSSRNSEEDFITKLVRREFNVGADGIAQSSGSGYINQFALDLKGLAGTAGTAQTNTALRDAIMVAAMEDYHTDNKEPASKARFFRLGEQSALAFQFSPEMLAAKANKAKPRLDAAIQAEIKKELGSTSLPSINYRDYKNYAVQSGTGVMETNGTANNDIIVGGTGSDRLRGGAGNDVIY
ncbi:MAG: DUF2974 domain-containing protein, partial [Rhodocyclaceae bacterium]|nr:DUF2974 domain-containing protein [Rhodocyclaceae bacterium]